MVLFLQFAERWNSAASLLRNFKKIPVLLLLEYDLLIFEIFQRVLQIYFFVFFGF